MLPGRNAEKKEKCHKSKKKVGPSGDSAISDQALSIRTVVSDRMSCYGNKQNLTGVAGGVTQLVEHRTRDPKTQSSNPVCVRSTRSICEIFSPSRKCCADSLSLWPNPPCVYALGLEIQRPTVRTPSASGAHQKKL